MQVSSSGIKLDVPGVFPEVFDKKKLTSSGSSYYVGGIRNVICHPTKQFVFVVWAGGAIQVYWLGCDEFEA